jgi:hypothetical protein
MSPLFDVVFEAGVFERHGKAHFDIVGSVLVEFVDPNAAVGVGGAGVAEAVEPVRPNQREKLLDKDQDRQEA